jgi:hypothetical protein
VRSLGEAKPSAAPAGAAATPGPGKE